MFSSGANLLVNFMKSPSLTLDEANRARQLVGVEKQKIITPGYNGAVIEMVLCKFPRALGI